MAGLLNVILTYFATNYEAHPFTEIMAIDWLMEISRFSSSVYLLLVPSHGAPYKLQLSIVKDLTYKYIYV